MGATFELFKSKKNKEYYWRLRHENGKIIADSGEGYKNKKDAIKGFESVMKNGPKAFRAYQRKSKARFILYRSKKNKKFYWRLVEITAAGNIIADSGQGYTTKASAKKGLNSVKRNAPDAPIVDLGK
jgi:uncharacterized protein YegP (UPF0339 family)